MLRTVVQGRRRDIGLGGLSVVSLAEAREQAAGYRKVARAGGDALAERRKARTSIPTFAEAAERVHDEHKASWRNPKHAQQWINTLRQYAYPIIGSRRVDHIDTPELLKVLAPIWLTKAETARRVRQRIGTVLDWSKAAGHRTGENPIDGVTKGLPKQSDRQGHHAALPYVGVPDFMKRLRDVGSRSVGSLAFEFLILTACRTSEALGAEWSEIDLHRAVWTIPGQRMKAKREHRVPLTPRCIEILQTVELLTGGSSFVFAGRSGDRPLSNMVFAQTLKRMEVQVTAHGFRSSFRDWAAEVTSFPREVAEMALAHTIGNKVEAAYRRGDLFAKRRELMQAWSDYVGAGA
jgi:integrase